MTHVVYWMAEGLDTVTVLLHLDSRGRWSVDLPGGSEVICETLDDARRVAYLCAARRRPCELLMQDAYHRVVRREFVDGA